MDEESKSWDRGSDPLSQRGYIGNGAIIATGSIVTKDIEPYTVVGGNPARIIKKRFSDNKINEFLKLRWWDLEIDVINKNIDYIVSGKIGRIQKLNEKIKY